MVTRAAKAGDLVEDTGTRRVGEVMGQLGGYVQLRPLGGGREWDVKPELLRPLPQGEALRLRLTRANASSSGRRRESWQGSGSATPAALPPLDFKAVVTSASVLLADDADVPQDAELERLTLLYRGSLMQLIPAVEAAVRRLPNGAPSGARALAGATEARARLDYVPGTLLAARITHAQRLARSVLCLVRHLGHLKAERSD